MSSSDLRFITFQNADDFKSRATRKAARSHINKQNLHRRRGDFKNTYSHRPVPDRNTPTITPSTVVSPSTDLINAINVEMLDPFETLPVDQSELQLLLFHRMVFPFRVPGRSNRIAALAQQAVEPVFSISAPFSFHDLHGAYANSFADPAFSSSLMCAILLAKHDYVFTADVLHYQGLAIESINRQLISPSSYECTVGAILLIVGVMWRMRLDDEAQIHLRGIGKLLQIYQLEKRSLSASVRRGIFWQDVNTAIVSARDRVMDRATFPEFLWGRSTFKVDWARLPSGFEDLRDQLGEPDSDPMRDIYVLLQDIYVLQKHGEALVCSKPDIGLIHGMDNMQACIEARLIEQLHDNSGNELKAAVMLTAYLYTYSLFTQIWNGSAIPLHIASRLLVQLRSLIGISLHKRQKNVLLWCTFTTACLIPKGPIRSEYGALLRRNYVELSSASSINAAWFAISGILDQYLWSQANFGTRALALLKENYDLIENQ